MVTRAAVKGRKGQGPTSKNDALKSSGHAIKNRSPEARVQRQGVAERRREKRAPWEDRREGVRPRAEGEGKPAGGAGGNKPVELEEEMEGSTAMTHD